MREVSVIIPSLREELMKQREVEWRQTNSDVNYELVVISPFEMNSSNVFWMKETERKGSVHATDLGCYVATGEYLIYFSDDVSPTNGCLRNMLDFMKQQTIHPFLGAFKMLTQTNKEIGPFAAYNKLYACYGCISKDDLMSLNMIMFKLEFKYSWGDIDLSLRVWTKGGKVEICDNACVVPKQIEDEIYKEHREKTFQEDVNTFLGIWHNRLGAGIERKEGAVNKKLVSIEESDSINQTVEPIKRGRGRPRKLK